MPRPRPVLLAALAAAAAAMTACGSDGTKTVTADQGPRAQVDPPRAAEPIAGPAVKGRIPGTTIWIGRKPEGVAIDPRTHLAAVAVQVGTEKGALVNLDDRTGRIVRRVPLPGQARHVSLAKPGGPFLVPVETANVVMTVDPRTGRTVTTKVGSHPHDATAVGSRIFTADEFGSTISVVRGGKLVGQVPADAQPGGIVAVGGKLALIAVRAYTVELFSAGDRPAGGGAQSAGLGPSHVVALQNGTVAIADTRGKALVVYGTKPTLRYRGRVALGGTPVGIAADDARGTVWAALSERAELKPVDLRGAKPRVGRAIRTVQNPFSVAVDQETGRLVTASRSEGTVQLVDP